VQEIGSLVNLQSLSAENNMIAQLPPTILKCTKLAELNLTRNRITSLPVGLKDMVMLKKLIATDNKLQKIPVCVMVSKYLREVDLALNEITSFPEDVSVLARYRGIHFEGNPLVAPGRGAGVGLTPATCSLKELGLRAFSRAAFESGAPPVFPHLPLPDHLKEGDEGECLDVEAREAAAQVHGKPGMCRVCDQWYERLPGVAAKSLLPGVVVISCPFAFFFWFFSFFSLFPSISRSICLIFCFVGLWELAVCDCII